VGRDDGRATSRKLSIGIFSALAVAVLAGAGLYHHHEHDLARKAGYTGIASIAQLKAEQIQRWRGERLSDVATAAENPFLAKAVDAWLGAGGAAAAEIKTDLTAALAPDRGDDLYTDVLLLDQQGHAVLSASREAGPVAEEVTRALQQALASRTGTLSDLYAGPHGTFLVDAVSPVVSESGRILALMDLRTDARRDLFPMIQSWPSPSPSAETLLVRADGGDALFLNELRHRKGTALSLRFPLSRDDSPAVQAVRGRRGLFEGKDYRGVDVLADLRPVAGTPWFLVTKIDAREVYTEARYRAGLSFLIAILLILLAGAGTAFAWRHRQARLYLSLLQLERRDRELYGEFRTTLYSIGDAVIGTDAAGLVWHMNPVAEHLTGWTEAEALGKPLGDVFHIINEETRGEIESPVQRVLRLGAVTGLANHTILVARDGSEKPVADSGAPIRDEQGRLRGVVLVFRDQSAERATLRALEASEQRYRSLVNNLGAGIASSDSSERFTFANPAAERIFGVAPGTLVGRNLEEFLSDAELAKVKAQTALRRAGVRSTYEIAIQTADGAQRRIQLSAVPEFDGTGSFIGTFGTVQDITDRQKAQESLKESEEQRELAEEERSKLQEQLQQASKMEAVGRLAGGIAHDFNNILTAIFGYCEIGLEHVREGDPLRPSFQQIRQSAQRAANLTSQLLTFSRRRMLRPNVVNLNELVAGMMDMLRRLLGEDIDVHVHPDAGLWNVRVDSGQIEQVIMNLAVNSRDAMPGGGVLTIATSNTGVERDYARWHADVFPGDYVVLAVSDTGHGMDEATMGRIYEPFFTTKEIGKGTGLGLATVYGIVKQSGGHISCSSELGKGTTFKVYLPRFEGDLARSDSLDPASQTGAVSKASILFVDDDEAVRSIAVSILQSAGYTVSSARDGAEALARLSSARSPVDLLITDVVMPGLSGVEVARVATERFGGTRVLYISGYSEDDIMHHGILQERAQLLQKPFAATDLLQTVKSILASPRT